MGAVVGIIGSIVSILFIYFVGFYVLALLLDFAGAIGLLAAIGGLVCGVILAVVAYNSSLARRVFSSRVWLIPIAIFAIMMGLSPLLFEGSYCMQARENVTPFGAEWWELFTVEKEGECISAGGLNWAMQQSDAIFRGLVVVGGVILFLLAFGGSRELPRRLQPRKVSLLGDWPPQLALRLATPPSTPPYPRPDGSAQSFTSEMAVALSEVARLNGGFVDMPLLQRLAREPAFRKVSAQEIADFARSQKIEVQ
jgi:hypothetical protein